MSESSILEMLSKTGALVIVIALWDGVWKAIALWHAARRNQKAWYVFLIIINSLGILPIVYLAFFRKNKPIQ